MFYNNHFSIILRVIRLILRIRIKNQVSFDTRTIIIAFLTISTKEMIPPMTVCHRSTETIIKSYVVQYNRSLLAFRYSKTSTHLLEIKRKRLGWSSQLYKLYIRTVKTFREDIDIHDNLYTSIGKVCYFLLTLSGWSCTIYHTDTNALCSI